MARFLSIDGEMLSGASACLGLGLDLFADTEAADQLAQLAGLAPQVRRRGRVPPRGRPLEPLQADATELERLAWP